MLLKPYLALCSDRTKLPKKHPYSGSPEEWFNNDILKTKGLFGISFDFFIDWNRNRLSNEIWIKRIVKDDYTNWPTTDNQLLQQKIYECDSLEYVKYTSQFAHDHNLILKYQLFKESYNWNETMRIVTVEINNRGSVLRTNIIKLIDLKQDIKRLSGGAVSIGKKGLIYGTSTLEGYLSHTDAAWPGDADLILIDYDFNPIALIEFKKHTLESPIENQQLSNYYPSPDKRKYDRLAILREYLGTNIPFVNLYYPTRSQLRSMKFEKVEGELGALRGVKVDQCSLPKNPKEYPSVVDRVLGFCS